MTDATPPAARTGPDLSRRALLLGGGFALGAAGAAATAIAATTVPDPVPSGEDAPAAGASVPAAGTHQAGISRPAVPQSHCLVAVADIDSAGLAQTLAALGAEILRLTDPADPDLDLTPDGPGDLTVTVGLGARPLAESGIAPELTALPDFRDDAALPADRRGGDLLLGVNASDPGILEPVMAALTAIVPGYALRWSEFGFRGPAADGVTRNPFGYYDGIIVPRTASALRENVWIADGPLAGGSICVIRRFALDTASFRALAPQRRDAVMGRDQATGAPLSGGARDDEVDLSAKADNGDLLVPARAHSRAAHPSFTGSGLMLRRSYNYRASASDHGHMFISYQAAVSTFARTQLRLDEVDDLMDFAHATATASFAILPGFTAASPLGASLF